MLKKYFNTSVDTHNEQLEYIPLEMFSSNDCLIAVFYCNSEEGALQALNICNPSEYRRIPRGVVHSPPDIIHDTHWLMYGGLLESGPVPRIVPQFVASYLQSSCRLLRQHVLTSHSGTPASSFLSIPRTKNNTLLTSPHSIVADDRTTAASTPFSVIRSSICPLLRLSCWSLWEFSYTAAKSPFQPSSVCPATFYSKPHKRVPSNIAWYIYFFVMAGLQKYVFLSS